MNDFVTQVIVSRVYIFSAYSVLIKIHSVKANHFKAYYKFLFKNTKSKTYESGTLSRQNIHLRDLRPALQQELRPR